MRRILLVVTSVVALSGLAACGGGGEAGGAGDGGGTSSTITMTDNEFVPSDPAIAAGEVELVNDGEAPHTFTVEGSDVDVEVEAGASSTTTIDLEPGTYTLFCRFHRSQGMEGTLTVEA